MDENFVITVRSMFERIMKETRTILVNMERRYALFCQQIQSWVEALERCRLMQPGTPGKIKSISQISDYVHHQSEHRVDTRICKIFLGLVHDLDDFRRTIERLSAPTNDATLEYVFSTWKKVLDPVQDISHLKERNPTRQLNQLSIEHARIYIGGIVSVLPIAMDCAQTAYRRLNAVKAYRDQANQYHFVEGLKIEKNIEKEERYFAKKYDKECVTEPCNDPLPIRGKSAQSGRSSRKSRSRSRKSGRSRSKSRGRVSATSFKSGKSNRPSSRHRSKSARKSQGKKSGSRAVSAASLHVGTKPQAVSRPVSGMSNVRSIVSSATASTASTESNVVYHIKNTLLNPCDMPSHGLDPRPRNDNVGRAFQWYVRKQTDQDSLASDQKRLKDAHQKAAAKRH